MPSNDDTALLLEVRGLTVTRPGDAGPLAVLRSVDLRVAAHTLVDVVGPSGSGKTTLLLAIAQLLPQVLGDVSLRGRSSSEFDPQVWRTRVAYLPQRSSLVPGTVLENLTIPWRLKVRAGEPAPSADRLRAALDRVRLPDVALERGVDRLSEGQAARVALLRCVLTAPDVLLLDEPDASLDNESAAEVGLITREFVDGGGAVVRVRHLRTDEEADRRLRLVDGALTEVAS